jgi:hypothetical protein
MVGYALIRIKYTMSITITPPHTARIACALLLCALLAACVPSAPVPQLTATAGPSFVVSDGRYQSDQISIVVPQGWRVISGPADGTLRVILVPSGDDALLLISDQPIEQPPTPPNATADMRHTYDQIDSGGRILYVYYTAPADDLDARVAEFMAVLDSIRIPQMSND